MHPTRDGFDGPSSPHGVPPGTTDPVPPAADRDAGDEPAEDPGGEPAAGPGDEPGDEPAGAGIHHGQVPSSPDGRVPAAPAVWRDHERYARDRDPAALDRLVREYGRYARSLAERMHRGHESIEDLEQIAMEALVVALRRFEPERGLPFPALATPTILGALRRHYRDQGWLVRVPRRVHELATALRDATAHLTVVLGRAPTVAELARHLDVAVDTVLEAQEALHARDTRSIDASFGDDRRLVDDLGGDDPGLSAAEDRLAAADAIGTLGARDRELLRLYFVEERTQSEVAEVLGVSQMQVSRLLSSVLRRLRQRVAPREGPAGR